VIDASLVRSQAEIMDLRAPAEGPAAGTVIESRVQRGLGPVCTAIVQSGSLRAGDVVLAGNSYGRVKKILSTDPAGDELLEAKPSFPVNVSANDGS
jgi:translation initiation factor IF-2